MVKLLGKKSSCCKAPLVQARTQIYCSSCGINPAANRRKKFNENDVAEMKRLREQGMSTPQIGAIFHAHHTTVILFLGRIHKKNNKHMIQHETTVEQKVEYKQKKLVKHFMDLYGIRPTERMLEQYVRNRSKSAWEKDDTK